MSETDPHVHAHEDDAHEDARAHEAREERARARSREDAHAHEDASPIGIDDGIVLKFFEWWQEMTEEANAINARKAGKLKELRAHAGPYHAEALKRACNLAMKAPEKVARDDVLNRAAHDYLKLLRHFH